MGFFPSSSKTADPSSVVRSRKDLPIYSEDSLMFRLGFAALAASALFLISGPALSAPTTVTTPPSAAAMKQLPRVAMAVPLLAVEAMHCHSQIMASVPATNPSALKFWSMQSLKSSSLQRFRASRFSMSEAQNSLSTIGLRSLAASILSLQTSTRMASSSHTVPIRLRKQRTFLTSL